MSIALVVPEQTAADHARCGHERHFGDRVAEQSAGAEHRLERTFRLLLRSLSVLNQRPSQPLMVVGLNVRLGVLIEELGQFGPLLRSHPLNGFENRSVLVF